MTRDELSRCHARALAAAGRLRLPLRSRVWKGQAGEFQGAGVGSSLDFQDHRNYVPGDDPRHINWQAYARTGQYTMKLYREEVRPVVDVVLDASESMFFDPKKAERAAELFCFVVESARRSGAATSVHLVRGDAVRPIPSETVAAHRWLDDARSLKGSDPSLPPDLSRIPFRGNAIRVLVSDLLFPGDPDPAIRLLCARQGSPILLVPFLQSEATPEWTGNYEFIDSERNSRHHHRIEPSVLRRYKESYANHFALWKNAARRLQCKMARVACDADLQTSLFAEALPSGALETVN
ncbi:DUF58 domain-containing protein [Haloferula sp. BvORR071]|uniref:DUF58 domain-containing protein n=1 Tax=Haloferula sp. BvORR071 TaxID=1396141 RepID=UPI0006963DD5|nr:DUF58 domain-containing protein [Haloferula sp. BvORR071]